MKRTFQLFHKTYTIETVDDLVGDRAQVDPDKAVVYINKATPKDERDGLFYHELVHAILWEIGREDLYEDERFVCPFASALYQAVKSLK